MSKKSFKKWLWEEFKKFFQELSVKTKLISSLSLFVLIMIVLLSSSFTSNSTGDDKKNSKKERANMHSTSNVSEFYTISEEEFNDLCENIIKNTPHDKDALAAAFYNVANDSAKKKYYYPAIKLYEKSLQYDSNNPSVYNNMASSYKYLGEIDQAEVLYKETLKIDPDYNNAYLQLALLNAHQHKKEETLKYFSIYEEKDPSAKIRIKHSLESEMKMGDISLGGKELLEYIR